MTCPPEWRSNDEAGDVRRLIERYPFAHIVSAPKNLHATRVPLVADFRGALLKGLRGHLNALNPQVGSLDGAEVLIIFSGPSAYVSPHWRSEKTRAGTYDYEEVRVRGTARLIRDMAFFTTLIDDLSALIEPQHAEVGAYPVWRTAMAPDGYIERLFPHISAFTVTVESVEMVSKLHQQFPREDQQSIVVHLRRSHREDSRLIAERSPRWARNRSRCWPCAVIVPGQTMATLAASEGRGFRRPETGMLCHQVRYSRCKQFQSR